MLHVIIFHGKLVGVLVDLVAWFVGIPTLIAAHLSIVLIPEDESFSESSTAGHVVVVRVVQKTTQNIRHLAPKN